MANIFLRGMGRKYIGDSRTLISRLDLEETRSYVGLGDNPNYDVFKFSVSSFEECQTAYGKDGVILLSGKVIDEVNQENNSEEQVLFCTSEMLEKIGEESEEYLYVIGHEVDDKELLAAYIKPDVVKLLKSVYKNYSNEEMYRLFAIYANLSPEQGDTICRFLRRELPSIKDGTIKLDEMFYTENEYKMVVELCADIYPPETLRYLRMLCDSRNREGYTSSQVKVVVRTIKNLALFPFYMKLNDFNVKEAYKKISKEFYGQKEDIMNALQAVRPVYDNSSKKMIRFNNIICVIGASGSGKTILGRSLCHSISDTHSELDITSNRISTENMTGSGTIYDNSKTGIFFSKFSIVGPTGSMLIELNKDINDDILSTFTEILKKMEFTDDSIEHPIGLDEMVFVLVASDKSEIPSDIYERSVIININNHDNYTRKTIGKDYIFKRLCRKGGIDSSKTRISDKAHDFICNDYYVTNSFHEVEENYKKIISYIKKKAQSQILWDLGFLS